MDRPRPATEKIISHSIIIMYRPQLLGDTAVAAVTVAIERESSKYLFTYTSRMNF